MSYFIFFIRALDITLESIHNQFLQLWQSYLLCFELNNWPSLRQRPNGDLSLLTVKTSKNSKSKFVSPVQEQVVDFLY